MARTEPIVVAGKPPFRVPRWWLPLGAAAAAVLIWMVVPQQQQIATAPPAAPVREQASPAAAPQEVAAPKAADAPRATVDALRDRAPAARVQDGNASKLTRNQQQAAGESRTAVAESPRAAAAADAARPTAPSAAAPAAPAPMRQAERFAAPVEVVSPDASKRWRFADYGSDVTGGAAVSSSICWLIGRAGLVMLTTNGTVFDHVDLPERVDVATITAADARSATVTTADGRRFQTDDGGRTWRLIPA
jgi:hypothetical protein